MSTNSSNSSMSEVSSNTGRITSSTGKQPSPKYCYIMVLNNYNDTEYNQVLEFCSNSSKKWIIGREVGENGTPHLQCYFSLKSKMRITELKSVPGFARCHFEEAKKGWKDNFMYCSEDGDYISEPKFTRPKTKKPIVLVEPTYPWQVEIINIINLPPVSDRKIIWVYDENGCGGKTTLMKHLHNAGKACFTTGGKKGDIMNLMVGWREEFETDHFCCIFNLPRDTNPIHVSYNSMEMLKDGIVENHKFECSAFLIHVPHVIVFANILPDFSKLSDDRWEVYTIDDNKCLKAWARGSNDPRDLL